MTICLLIKINLLFTAINLVVTLLNLCQTIRLRKIIEATRRY